MNTQESEPPDWWSPPLCMYCGGEGDRWETLDQNGGWEWWTYCATCDVETFSETYPFEVCE